MKLIDLLNFSKETKDYLLGYSDEELERIEKIYDIHVCSQLADFLRIMGKSCRGLIGDDGIQLYRSSWPAATQLDFQQEFRNDMTKAGFGKYLNKPFVIAWLSENQYFFVQTASDQPDLIYHYNEVEKTAKKTRWDLFGFLESLIEDYKDSRIVNSVGELLEK